MEEGQLPEDRPAVEEEEEAKVSKRKLEPKSNKKKKKKKKKEKKKRKRVEEAEEKKPVLNLPKKPTGHLITVLCNDRLGRKVRVKCNSDDTIGDFKKVLAAQIGTKASKLKLMKWQSVFKDHITLDDYEVHNGFNFELYYI